MGVTATLISQLGNTGPSLLGYAYPYPPKPPAEKGPRAANTARCKESGTMTRAAIASMLLAGMLVGTQPASAQTFDETSYIGSVFLVGFGFCPAGTVEAAGQLIDITSDSALYSLLGIRFGGDGRRTFALPDLRNSAPVDGMRYCIVVDGVYPPR